MTEEEAPETYWEKRAAITENVLTAVIQIIGNTLPPEYQDALDALCDKWVDTVDGLVK